MDGTHATVGQQPNSNPKYETQKAKGLYLINLQGRGSGSNTRYAAIRVSQDIPSARTWRVIGGIGTGLKEIPSGDLKH